MRTFIAIELPEEVKEQLREIQQSCKGIKASFVKDFHLTLKFLGEVDEKTLEKVKEKLREIKFKSFKLKLSSVGCFPSEKYIRVLWVGTEPEDEVAELQKNIEEALKEFKFKKDFKFKAHLTLARVRFIDDKEAFIEKFKNIDVKPMEFEVFSFSLMKSILSPKGAVYEELEKFEFVWSISFANIIFYSLNKTFINKPFLLNIITKAVDRQQLCEVIKNTNCKFFGIGG